MNWSQGNRGRSSPERRVSRRHKPPEALGKIPDSRDGSETDQAGQERGLTAEHIADPPAQREQAPERQRVGGDEPIGARRLKNAAPAALTAARC
jgi:hypothetical protein